MCDPVTIGLTVAAVAVTAGGQIYAGDAAYKSAQYQAAVANRNADMADRSAQDANKRGEQEQLRHWRKVSQQLGDQRAKFAAAGLDLNFGTPADVVEDTMQMGYEDAFTIGENTKREVEGFDIEAANHRAGGKAAMMEGRAKRTAGYIGAAGTILGGASQLYGQKAKAA
jgi:hypothetical protein